MNLDKKQKILIYKIILCVLSWITMGLLLRGLLSATSLLSLATVASTYTFQSNLFVFLWINCDVIFELLKKEKPFILGSPTHGAVTLYITVTFVIFALILQPLIALEYGIASVFEIGNLMCHYIIPILMIVEWSLTHNDDEYKRKWALYWLIYPYIYLMYSIIIELTTGVYFYFFISIKEYGALVIVSIALLTLFFYGIARLSQYRFDAFLDDGFGGAAGRYHLKAQLFEEGSPKGQKLIVAQA